MRGWTREAWVPWAAVGVTALLAHLILIVETCRTPAFAFPLIDSSTYHQMAEAFLRGGFPRTPYWQPPLFPWFLAGIYGIVGTGMTATRVVMGLIGVAGALLTLAAGRRLAGRGVGVAAGLAAAVYGPLLFFETQLMPVGLAVVFDLALLMQVLRALERPSAWRWLSAGLLLGLAGLTVPNALVMGAVAAPLAWRAGREEAGCGRRWRWAALFLAGAALVVAPVTVRNRLVGGQWVLISSNGGINFYIGNNARLEVTMATRPGLDWERLTQVAYRNGAQDAREADRYFWAESFRFMIRRPGLFLRNTGWKARQFLAGREIPRNLDLYTFREHSFVLKVLTGRWGWLAWPFGVLGPLALVGLGLAWGWGRENRVAAGFVVMYALSVILVFPTARYRAPLIPLFLIYGIGALAWLARRAREPGAAWWVGMAGLGVAAVLVNAPVPAPTDGVRFDAELENAMGAACQMRGQREAAWRHYVNARAADPQLADAAYNMGVLLGELRQREAAIQAYREALRIRPDHDKARVNLGIALFQENRLGEAADMLEMATVLNPGNPKAWHNRALVLDAMGRPVEAQSCRRQAARLTRGYGPSCEGGGNPAAGRAANRIKK